MKFPEFKKEISLFLSSEEAKVLKKDIAKIGLTAGAIAVIMAQSVDAEGFHGNSHDDAEGHSDHSNHSSSHADSQDHGDSTTHSSAHGNHADHADSHTNDPGAVHNSSPAVYDEANRRGGHNSFLSHANSHSDS
ncbi:MAG: hypothetical protein MJA29_13570 [Candidatus Omnitrophica bacterium]|nr:hypothetical protein [Candidatus Omnitrophota bacterium]